MRNPATIETVESLRLRERIADFESKMYSLGFQNPQHKKFSEASDSEVQKFLENKVGQQNQEYLQKASENPGAPHQTPSDLFGYKSENKATQIKNLLEQVIHNKGKGSFESRNASAFDMAISGSGKAILKLGRSLSLTSMSSGGDLPQQKNSSLQKSQSLPTSQKFRSTQQLQSDKKITSKTNHNNLRKPDPLIKFRKQGEKPVFLKKIKNFLSKLTFKKTKQTNSARTSREGAKSKKVDPKPSRDTSSLSGNSSFASSRSGSISNQSSNSSTRSQSFNNGLRSQQSIASRNQSISRSNSDRAPQGSFSSQNSLGSRGSHASKVSQSRSGEGKRNAPRR